jgi:hypothetical protein
MKRAAQTVTWIVLIVYLFYTVGGVAIGTTPMRAQLFFPVLSLGTTLIAYQYLRLSWLVWTAIALNAVFGLAGLAVIIFGNAPLWWILLIGGAAIVGSSSLNVATLCRFRNVAP